MLVAVAATVAMLEANWLIAHTVDTRISIMRLDMMRLPLGILSGIGFIGAGAILRRGEMVRGLTTAATLWLVTVIGLCFGGGQVLLGIAATIVALVTLWLLKYVEAAAISGRRGTISLTFSTDRAPDRAFAGRHNDPFLQWPLPGSLSRLVGQACERPGGPARGQPCSVSGYRLIALRLPSRRWRDHPGQVVRHLPCAGDARMVRQNDCAGVVCNGASIRFGNPV